MKVAVLGLGSAGRRHAANAIALGHAVVAFDPGDRRAPDGTERAGSEEEAIEAAAAVVVASPSSLHADQAIAALEAGKSVLVEKPLAASVEDAERVAAAADSSASVCAVAMNLRFHRGVLELKRLVDSGELGDVRLVRASFGYDLRLWRPGTDYRESYSARADLGGGIVLDAIHELDYLLWLFGPVASVSAETGRLSDLEIDVEDAALALLRFESGALGSVDLNFIEPAYRRGCHVVGTNATATWDWNGGTVTVRRDGQADEAIAAECAVAETYVAELADFVAGAEPRADARDGLAAMRLADALKRSASEGRRLSLAP